MLPGRGRTPPGDRLSLSHGGRWWEAILEGRRERVSAWLDHMLGAEPDRQAKRTGKKNRDMYFQLSDPWKTVSGCWTQFP